MKRFLLAVGVIIGGAFLGFAIYSTNLRNKEKSLSPEATVRYADNDIKLSVMYSRPSKKGREIFGSLVPYGKPWRTGANDATVFSCSQDILVNGKKVEEGRYQLITIPFEDHWTVILNSDIPGWGINQTTGQVYHNTKADVLAVDVPVMQKFKSIEQFTISFDKQQEGVILSFSWDEIKVNVPISRQ